MPRPPYGPQSTPQPIRPDFASRLLTHLRTTFASPELEYTEPPQGITGGFDTLTYSLALGGGTEDICGPLILRVFRTEHPSAVLKCAERVRFESVIQNTIGRLGYPAPRVRHTWTDAEIIGAPFLLMERLPGHIMLDLFFRPSRVWLRLPDLLAEAHARLHSLEGAELERAVQASGLPPEAVRPADRAELAVRIERASLGGLRAGMRWLLANEPQDPRSPSICHGDFHPLNVLVDEGTVSGVIDWTYTRIADPAYDVGATIALFGQGPIDLPGFVQSAAGLFRRWIIRRYYDAYRRVRALDENSVRYYEALRCLGFLVEAGEHRQGLLGVIDMPEKPTAFGAPRTVRGIVARFREITGVELALPSQTVKVR